MNVLFEELAPAQRMGGIEAATGGLVAAFSAFGLSIERRDSMSPLFGQWTPDLVHLHGIWSPALARRWWHWHKMGKPCMVTTHGMLEPWALAHKRWKKQVAWHTYQKQILNRVGLLHATSEREAKNLRALGLKPPIAMIPWGIEVAEEGRDQKTEDQCSGESATAAGFHPTIHNPRSTIHDPQSAIQDPSRTALFVGRIYPVKGLPLLVKAWAQVRPAGWKMKIVGPDEAGHLAEVEALVQQAGLDEVFEFAGPLSGTALEQAYNDADLYIQPSHTENFGMAIAEAMAHRLPVITTHGAPWKLLEDESCGWWVPVSVDGIAAALDDATRRSPEELAAMGERGRAVVVERFSWDKIAADMIACYEWVLGRGAKPDCVRQC